MNRKLQIIISASAVFVLAFSALAQDISNLSVDKLDHTHTRMARARRADRLNDAAKASDVIGMTVKNYKEEKLGTVEDLAVDVESGRIVQVILSSGGFIGVGETLTAVPPGAFHHEVSHRFLHLDADKEKLRSAPKFLMSKWAECCDSNHLSTVYRHYGENPDLMLMHPGAGTVGMSHTVSTPKAAGTPDRDRTSRASQSMIQISRPVQIQKASKLLGTLVRNLQGEKLGQVENILFDLPSGRVVVVIISSGRFLGLVDELSAVPPTALQFTTERMTLQLDASKETLSNAPHFKAYQWPDFAQPRYVGEVYRAYRIEPYFTADMTTEVEDKARIRGREERLRTPLD